ncbi:MAG: VCBS repeat-containing protein, partial [Planctomycetales bacterium]|nr:VCBS repeat-containing protein [Planctomycetales bacterium]
MSFPRFRRRNSIRHQASMQSLGQFERLETKRLLTAVELTTEQVLLDANDFDQYRNATLELADVNADGITDVVVARHATGEFGWMAVSAVEFGWATAVLQPVGVEAGLLDVTVQDFIGDSHVDFLVRTDTSLVLYEQTSNSTFQRHAIWGSNDTIRSLEILDFDFDGQADLAVLDDLDQITILHNNGDGTFTQTDSSRVGFLVGQIDYQSRDTSFLIGNDEQGTVHRHFVNQDGVLSNSGPVVAELSAYSRSPFLLTDFDGDNQVDMLANSQGGLDWLEWNSTKQAFVFSETLIPDRTFESIDVFDFDGDGQLELLLPDSEGYVEYQRSPDESGATSYVRNLSRRFTNYAIADRAHDASGPMLITANGAENRLVAFDDHGMSSEMRAPRISRPAATSNMNSRIIDQDLVIKAVDGGAILYSNFTEGNTIGRIVAPPQPELRFDRSVIIDGVTGLVWFGDGYIQIQPNALEPTLSDKLHGVLVMDTGEFNGDGRTDLLLAEGDRADIESTGLEGTVRMAIQSEDGQWSIQGELSLWFPEMLDVTARDLNRDGLDDLVRHRWYLSQLYSVRLNTGDGQFDEVREIFNHEY